MYSWLFSLADRTVQYCAVIRLLSVPPPSPFFQMWLGGTEVIFHAYGHHKRTKHSTVGPFSSHLIVISSHCLSSLRRGVYKLASRDEVLAQKRERWQTGGRHVVRPALPFISRARQMQRETSRVEISRGQSHFLFLQTMLYAEHVNSGGNQRWSLQLGTTSCSATINSARYVLKKQSLLNAS